MSEETYKSVTKVNITLQIEVQRFDGSWTLDAINKAASKEAIEIASRIIRDSKPGCNVAICGSPSVLSIMVKDSA